MTHLSSWEGRGGHRPAPGADAPARPRERPRRPPRTLVDALARVLDVRDRASLEHAERVQQLAVALAQEQAIGDVHQLEAIRVAALLHDIGKLGIPDAVLRKPGPLTAAEYEQVKQHSVIGAQILAPLSGCGLAALIVRHHHENWNGSGYPDGLRGEGIPVGARVLAVADCFDALTSDRPYRRELSADAALEMIRARRGTMYDPEIVDRFMAMMSAQPYQDRRAPRRDHFTPHPAATAAAFAAAARVL